MSEYAKKLEAYRKGWKSVKPLERSGFVMIPEGQYNAQIIKVKFDQETLRVIWYSKILDGEYTGKLLNFSCNLTYAPDNPDKPHGIQIFMTQLSIFGLTIPDLTEKLISDAMVSTIGSIIQLNVIHKDTGQGKVYQNAFLNTLIKPSKALAESQFYTLNRATSNDNEPTEINVEVKKQEPNTLDVGRTYTLFHENIRKNVTVLSINEDKATVEWKIGKGSKKYVVPVNILKPSKEKEPEQIEFEVAEDTDNWTDSEFDAD